jgi:HlyD family secretion protein
MTVHKESRLFKNAPQKWRMIFAASITLATLAIALVSLPKFHRSKEESENVSIPIKSAKIAPVKLAVTALGKIQPAGKITYLSAPNSINGVRVEKLFIKEGDEVKAGQILAYLENYQVTKTALQQAFDKLLIAKTQLAQVKAGAKWGDINAQKANFTGLKSQLTGTVITQEATIKRIQAAVENADTENKRYQQLLKEGAVSASVADSKTLQLKTTQQQLAEAKATLKQTQDTLSNQIKESKSKLNSIKEVRPEDVELAIAQVKSAETGIKQAKANFDLSYIISPINGRILKINTKSGEIIATSGFAEIGETSQMMVIAEVYQTDIQKVHLGQKAFITSGSFPGKIQGTVREVGWQISKQSIFSTNPDADTDQKIVEVKIMIDSPADSEKVSRLTNLQVDVAIQI